MSAEPVSASPTLAHRYAVAAMFLSLQGEGMRTGTACAWVRLAGCNLWSGDPKKRHEGKGSCALWCDADFRPRERLTLDEIITRLDKLWPALDAMGRPKGDERWVVITGGEPMLQLDREFVQGLAVNGWRIAVETNGSVAPREGVADYLSHVCVSPKQGSGELVHHTAYFAEGPKSHDQTFELKVVCSGEGGRAAWPTGDLWALGESYPAGLGWAHYVQPCDPLVDRTLVEATHLIARRQGLVNANREAEYRHAETWCIEFVKAHPSWSLSMQTHKLLGIE